MNACDYYRMGIFSRSLSLRYQNHGGSEAWNRQGKKFRTRIYLQLDVKRDSKHPRKFQIVHAATPAYNKIQCHHTCGDT